MRRELEESHGDRADVFRHGHPGLHHSMGPYWLAIQETLFLESVPGLADSIRRSRAEGVDAGSTELDW